LKQRAYVLLKEEEAWAINRMTGKRLTEFQNPVILSKTNSRLVGHVRQ
jgi:hypothetical protein